MAMCGSRNFFRGGGGGGVQARRPKNSLENVFFVVFLVLNLFYSLQRGFRLASVH